MQKKLLPILLLPSSLALIAGLSSSSNGAAASQSADRTGSPVSSGTCANCHSGGNSVPGLSVQLLDNGTPQTSYRPGQTYTLKVTVSGTEYTRFGFQSVALNSSEEQAGTLSASSTGTRVTTLSDRQYGEHNNPIANGVFELSWKAPATGTGAVRVYTSGLGAKNPGNTDGDRVANNVLTLTEEAGSNTVAQAPNTLQLYPNPAVDFVYFGGEILNSVRILTSDGKEIRRFEASTDRINVGNLPTGLYLLEGSRADGKRINARFIRS